MLKSNIAKINNKGKTKFRKKLFHKLVAPIKSPMDVAIKKFKTDKGYRKFFTEEQVYTQIHYQLEDGNNSLRALNEARNDDEEVKELLQVHEIDVSNLSRANKNRDYRVFRYIFHALFPKALKACKNELGALLSIPKVKILDGSFFECCMSMIWANYKKTKNACKLHLLMNLNNLPEKIVLTDGKKSEREILRKIIKRGVTYIIDRGYNSYLLFVKISQKGAFFITRLLKNAVFEVVKELDVSDEDREKGIISDQLILLGKDPIEPRKTFRLITLVTETGKIYRFLTNRMDLEALMVAQLYRCRWQIESFFRWIKMHLKIKHFLGRSKNAVLIQLYAGLITFLLLRIFAEKIYHRTLNLSLFRKIKHHLSMRVSSKEIKEYLMDIDSS